MEGGTLIDLTTTVLDPVSVLCLGRFGCSTYIYIYIFLFFFSLLWFYGYRFICGHFFFIFAYLSLFSLLLTSYLSSLLFLPTSLIYDPSFLLS